MKKRILLLTIMAMSFQFLMEAQSIRRSTLCSVGKSDSIGVIRIASSFGQHCVSCSVEFDGDNYLRQGFQQPVLNSLEAPCGFNSAVAFEELQTPCGTYYNFEYMGTATPNNATFLWDFGPSSAPATSTEMNPQNIAYATTGNKLVTLTITGPDDCTESAVRVVQVTETAFAAIAVSSDVTCYGAADGSIDLDIFGGTDPIDIVWSDGSPDGRIRTNLEPGDYTFKLTDANGCPFENTITIAGPDAALGITIISKVPESCAPAADGSIEIELKGGTSPYTIDWSTGGTDLKIESLSKGDYTLTVTDANGCTETAGFELLEWCTDGKDIVYDVITPNNDGQNDVWIIEGIENFPKNKVEVFNRWGSVVWSQDGYTNDWYGTNNSGEELPAGAYYYLIRFNDPDDTTVGGSVTIVR